MHSLTLNCLTSICYYSVASLPRSGKTVTLINILDFIDKVLKDAHTINLRCPYYVVLTYIMYVNI